MLEINPLSLDADGGATAIGTLMDIDDDALFRQPELAQWIEYGASRFGRQATPLERRLFAMNLEGAGSMRFMQLEGAISAACSPAAAAASWSADHIIDRGGKPATYYDATTPNETMLRALFEGVLQIPGLRGLVFGSNIINLARIESRVRILVEALEASQLDFERFPVVLRMAGPGEEEARRTASRVPHLEYYGDEVTLEYALDRFVDRGEGRRSAGGRGVSILLDENTQGAGAGHHRHAGPHGCAAHAALRHQGRRRRHPGKGGQEVDGIPVY